MTSTQAPLAPARPDETEADAADAALIACIERLEALIEAETQALKSGGRVDFKRCNARKAHALLEFMTLSRGRPRRFTQTLAARVTALEQKLARNAQTLEQHLRALSEICEIAINRLKAEESDGTYSRRSIPRR